MPENQKKDTINYSDKLLASNVIYNLAGQLLPIVTAFFVIPPIIRQLGIERFGVLTLVWMVVGYFSLFDMGIGRATTKFTAEYIGSGKIAELPYLIWNSIYVLLGLGVLAGIFLALLSPYLVNHLLKIPAELKSETLKVFYVLAVSIPFILGTSSSRGVLEAQQRFLLVNVIKLPASLTIFIAPLFVLLFVNDIVWIAVALIASRILFFIIYLAYCIKSIPDMNILRKLDVERIKLLISYGGWLTVSSIIGPFMTYMDRFIIGAMISLSDVAYYATPYDMVTRLWILSGSLLVVIFPIFSMYSVRSDQEKTQQLFNNSLNYLLIILTPIVVIITVLAEPILTYWLGTDFAAHSVTVTQILSFGVIVCAVSQVPYTIIQAAGRPDVTAKFHLVELPVYMALMWYIIPKYGIIGAAISWLLRIIVDAIMLFWFYLKKMGVNYRRTNRLLRLFVFNALLIIVPFIIISFRQTIFTRISILISFAIIFSVYIWRMVTNSNSSIYLELLGILDRKLK